jgi:hypothetical protein
MKKFIIILITLIAISLVGSNVHAGLDLGGKLGYNAAKLSTNLDSIKSSMSSGFHIGAWARIGKRFHVQPEFIYTMSNTTFENVWKQRVTVNSLDIPVLLGFNLINSDALKLRINAGPKVSLPLSTKLKDLTLTGPIEDVKLNSTNWSIQMGGGVDFLIFTVDIRYQVGLNNVLNELNGKSTSTSVDTKGTMFVVSAGIKIL